MDFDYIGEVEGMDTHVEYLSGLLGFSVIFVKMYSYVNSSIIKLNDLGCNIKILYSWFLSFQHSVNANLHEGSSVHDRMFKHLDALEVDRQFFSKVPKNLIKQLYDNIYKPDFEMLGYEYPHKYIHMGYGDVVE